MNRVKLFIFYGIPCAGKSSISVKFAYENNIKIVVATDYLREVQRAYLNLDVDPALFKVSHDAWQLIGKATEENIIEGFKLHSNSVYPALNATCKKIASDGIDSIIEGVHFYSDIVGKLSKISNVKIIPMLIAVQNKETLIEHILKKESKRSKSGEQKKWFQRVEILWLMQSFLVQDALKNQITIKYL